MIILNLILLLIYAVASAVPLAIVFYLIYLALKMPLERRERSAFLIDVLDSGMTMGRSAEQSIVWAADSGDPELAKGLAKVATRVRQGARFGAALDTAPKLFPPQIRAMLQAGEKTGTLGNVLPACRRLLQDTVSGTRSAFNYLILVLFVLTPMVPAYLLILHIFILPKWMNLMIDLSSGPVPWATGILLNHREAMIVAEVLFVGTLWTIVFAYIRGPVLSESLKAIFGSNILDRIPIALPWQRKRLQRDFATMLALLLDAGVQEPQAIQTAAESTANSIFIQRGKEAVAELGQGKTLAEAMDRFDDNGEFRWRLKNAANSRDGFLPALSAWIEALDAKSFQLEQGMSHAITTGLVLCNGLIVGLVATGLFQALILITGKVDLW